jgi:hypothetical protein
VLKKINIAQYIPNWEDATNVKINTIYLLILFAYLKNQAVFIKLVNVHIVITHSNLTNNPLNVGLMVV